MNIFEDIVTEGLVYIANEIKDKLDALELTKDYSKYNRVDGEEGDNGIIKYYIKTPSGLEYFGCKIDHGGDSYDYELSETGKYIMMGLLINVFTDEKAMSQIVNKYFNDYV